MNRMLVHCLVKELNYLKKKNITDNRELPSSWPIRVTIIKRYPLATECIKCFFTCLTFPAFKICSSVAQLKTHPMFFPSHIEQIRLTFSQLKMCDEWCQ